MARRDLREQVRAERQPARLPPRTLPQHKPLCPTRSTTRRTLMAQSKLMRCRGRGFCRHRRPKGLAHRVSAAGTGALAEAAANLGTPASTIRSCAPLAGSFHPISGPARGCAPRTRTHHRDGQLGCCGTSTDKRWRQRIQVLAHTFSVPAPSKGSNSGGGWLTGAGELT